MRQRTEKRREYVLNQLMYYRETKGYMLIQVTTATVMCKLLQIVIRWKPLTAAPMNLFRKKGSTTMWKNKHNEKETSRENTKQVEELLEQAFNAVADDQNNSNEKKRETWAYMSKENDNNIDPLQTTKEASGSGSIKRGRLWFTHYKKSFI